MRFLILTQYFAPEIGASQVRLSSMCRQLVRAGHEVEVVTGMPNHPAGRIFPEYRNRFWCREFHGRVRVSRIWLYAANGSGLQRILNYLSFMFTCLIGLCGAQKPDVIFVDSPPLFLGVPGWLASVVWKCPFIFNVADLWPDTVRDLGVMKPGLLLKAAYWLEGWIYRRADYITAVTEGIRNSLLNEKKVPPAKVLFLPNGVDTALFKPGRADESLKNRLGLKGKRIAIYAGNHGYAAGADQILNAAKLLSGNTSLHFVLVGDGPEKPKLRQLAIDLGLKNISFLEPVRLEELPALLSISELAVVSLRKTGVTMGARPAKTFVMMAAGKPIVLAADGEAADLIGSAGAGLIVPPYEPQRLANAIQAMLDNPEAASEMGRRGRTFVEANFEWSVLVCNWVQQLRNAGARLNAKETAYEISGNQSPAKL